MTAKDFLQVIYKRRCGLQSVREHIEELQASAGGISAIRYDKDRVQVSPEDHMSEAVARMIEAEEEYGRLVVEYHKAVIQRTKMIQAMPDPRYVALLTHRYIDCLRFEEIAYRMNYSWKHVLRLHGEALDAFAKQYEGEI